MVYTPPTDDKPEKASSDEIMAANSGELKLATSDERGELGEVGHLESQSRDAHLSEEAKLVNPLLLYNYAQLEEMGRAFAAKHNMHEFKEEFAKGACIARDPTAFEKVEILNEKDKAILRTEATNRWSHPAKLWWMAGVCSVAAAVQGMDQVVVSGANLFFPKQFGIENNPWLVGAINAAPYICCALFSVWLTAPLNKLLGRKRVTFLTCLISSLTCLGQGFVSNWQGLFAARFLLGLGIGPKSSTVPIYASEFDYAMANLDSFVFGIMFGYAMDLAFYYVPDVSGIGPLNWRFMIGSACLPPIFVCLAVWYVPESPRWLMSQNRYVEAYESMSKMRTSMVQAARDMYLAAVLLEAEEEIKQGRNRLVELVTVPRNRRAMLGSFVVMFGQQFCGVDVIGYYSGQIFLNAGFSTVSSLAAALGFGTLNFLFAFPAIFTIDTSLGRRGLLLISFPLMSVFLFWTGFSFWIPDETARTAMVALGVYLFVMVYSPGEGPVPFVYPAEAFPLYVRDLGMSWAFEINWFFNALVALTFPSLLASFGNQGAFSYYATWDALLFIVIFLVLPETRGLTLEELDAVFSVPTSKHAI